MIRNVLDQPPFPIMPPDRHEERRELQKRGVGFIGSVDWEMMAEHEAQALRNHDQTLAVLASRGGLSACEAVAILEDRDWHPMPSDEAYRRLATLLSEWLARQRERT